jgi:hypothetical protein
LLCLLGRLALPSNAAPVADVPARDGRAALKWSSGRASRAPCLICATSDKARQRPVKLGPFLTAFHLVFLLENYLDASGLGSPGSPLPLRLSLVAPHAPNLVPSREAQDTESLSLYVLELSDEGVVATARQQGRGGFWGQLEVGERILAEVNGFLTRRGGSGAFWFATHAIAVRSNTLQLGGEGAPALFGFLSFENALARGPESFDRLAALPGLGVGARWRVASLGTLTATSGINAGAWFDLKGRGATPAISVGLGTLQLVL